MTASEVELSVDELAQKAGTTVRNVRLYQERGLVPKPERRGRKAVYSAEHLTRLQTVLRLMGRGYSLAAIKDLTEAWDRERDLGHVLGLKDTVGAQFTPEEPMRISREELAELYPPTDGLDLDACLARDVEIGILVRDGDDFIVPSPTFLLIGKQLVESGLPFPVVEEMAAEIFDATRRLAEGFVGCFLDHVWTPFVAAGQPEAEAHRVLELVGQLSPLTIQAVVSALNVSMQERIDKAMMDELGG